jgi:hypothetical protein
MQPPCLREASCRWELNRLQVSNDVESITGSGCYLQRIPAADTNYQSCATHVRETHIPCARDAHLPGRLAHVSVKPMTKLKTPMNTKAKNLLVVLILLVGTQIQLFAQGSAFTYQGRLNSNSVPANGLYDFEFSLSNAPSGGSQIGSPMAQDFYAAFNLGQDNKHITTIDEGGVALAAIQGLDQKLNEKDTEIKSLKSQNDSLSQRLNELELVVKALAEKK